MLYGNKIIDSAFMGQEFFRGIFDTCIYHSLTNASLIYHIGFLALFIYLVALQSNHHSYHHPLPITFIDEKNKVKGTGLELY